jgi:murein DD-endopeptidase MepM/ murein hydrolase activator NlpD
MHTGIDIGVGYGTPIVASASGNVIFAGWMGGYGNFVIVDHGGGLSTAYAHQSSIAVGGGGVSQGQVLGSLLRAPPAFRGPRERLGGRSPRIPLSA